jgi:hypothetical protein
MSTQHVGQILNESSAYSPVHDVIGSVKQPVADQGLVPTAEASPQIDAGHGATGPAGASHCGRTCVHHWPSPEKHADAWACSLNKQRHSGMKFAGC